jgi:DNA-binding XRE family transcriptional regulator
MLTENNMKIHKLIKEIREILNISQRELSRKLGLSHACIGYYEKSMRKPEVETCYKIIELIAWYPELHDYFGHLTIEQIRPRRK